MWSGTAQTYYQTNTSSNTLWRQYDTSRRPREEQSTGRAEKSAFGMSPYQAATRWSTTGDYVQFHDDIYVNLLHTIDSVHKQLELLETK